MSHILKSACIVLTCVLTLAACSSGESKDNSLSNLPSDPTRKTEISPLYVIISSTYDGAKESTTHGVCYFEATDQPPLVKTCTVRIPELMLYYSKLDFIVGTNDLIRCAQVSFNPYYYLITNSNAATFPGEKDPVDCTLGGKSICWGGAAPRMVASFPKSAGLYFLPTLSLRQTFTLQSSSEYRIKGNGEPMYNTNVTAANNLLPGLRNTQITSPIDYAGGNMYRDYSV